MMIYLEHRSNDTDTREFVFGIKGKQTPFYSKGKAVVAALVAIALFIITVQALP